MRRRVSRAIALLGVALAVASASAQGLVPLPPPGGPGLELGVALAADGASVVYPTRIFPAGTPEVIVVVRLGGQLVRVLQATWMAVDAPGASPGAILWKASHAPQGAWGVQLRLAGPLRPGKYRLDVETDGTPWQSASFVAIELAGAPEVRRAEDLLPLGAATTWTYERVREEAPAGPPGGGPPGQLVTTRDTVTWTARETDARGTRAERRFDGSPSGEQWWRPPPQGLELTASRIPGQGLQTIDPPKLLWPFPPTAMRAWKWTSGGDARDQQSFRAWGPLEVHGPQGPAVGSVVLVEWSEPWPEGEVKQSLERHYLPGVGLVREIHIGGTGNGFRLWRYEMTLTDVR
jgi:hypothetical protein